MADIAFSPRDYPNGVKEGPARFGSGDSVTVREGLVWNADTVALRAGTAGDLDLRIEGIVATLRNGADLGGRRVGLLLRVRRREVVGGHVGRVRILETHVAHLGWSRRGLVTMPITSAVRFSST